MAALPVIPDVYRVAMNWTGPGGQNAVNVIHVAKVASTPAAVAAAVDAAAVATMWSAQSSGATVTSLNVTPLDGSSASFILATTGAKWTGSNVGDFSPATANIVSLRTALRGRSHRGRVYLPFCTEGQISNGSLVAGVPANVQTGWNSFQTTLSAGATILVVASYLHATAQAVTSLLAETVLATQRRRQSRLR